MNQVIKRVFLGEEIVQSGVARQRSLVEEPNVSTRAETAKQGFRAAWRPILLLPRMATAKTPGSSRQARRVASKACTIGKVSALSALGRFSVMRPTPLETAVCISVIA